MMRDVNPSGKFHAFIGEQPRKLVDKNSKSFPRHKKSHNHSVQQDSDEFSRDRHSYHRAATKNVTREILRSNQF